MPRSLIVSLLFVALAGPIAAQGPPGGASLTVGPAVLVRDSAYSGAKPEMIPIPWIDFSAGRWTVRGLQAAYELGGAGPLRVSATGNLRLGGIDPDDLEPRLEIADRAPTVEIGLAASLPVGSWRASVEAAADVLGRHGGVDAAVRLSRPLRAGRLFVLPAAGLRYWSGALAAYDYGLEPGEAGVADGYDPGSALVPEVSVAGTFRLNERWSVVGFGRVLRLDDGIARSPVVDGRTESLLGVGLGYRIRL